MAITSETYRLSTLAKDFDLKNKDIVEILKKYDFTPKSTMTPLEEPQLSIVFQYLTQNNQINLTDYFAANTPKKPKNEEESAAESVQNNDQTKKQPDNSKPVTTQKKKDRSQVRVVDTRGTVSVDLSKYEDTHAKLYTETDSESSANKQKIKKKNQQHQYGDKAKQPLYKDNRDKSKKQQPVVIKPVKLSISVPDSITVVELASRMKITGKDVLSKLISMGFPVTSVNSVVDFDTACLLGDDFHIDIKKEVVLSLEERLFDDTPDSDESLSERAPVVVVMGHVDHGKTSLLDAIRHTHVTSGEAGGITQRIGAYRVNINGKDITFLDTPGHEAFTSMRARGAMLTDIAILVVAADDGVKPQTEEAIAHAKAANVSIIVAINKMDAPGANPDNVMQQLLRYELVPEQYGGDTICIPVSAITKSGITKLLEMVLLTSEMLELKANPNKPASGAVVEAKLDKGCGAVATVLVQNGTLRTGDMVIAGTSVGKVRVMIDDKGQRIRSAGPSVPVEIMGLDTVPNAGDCFRVVSNEKLAKELAERRKFDDKFGSAVASPEAHVTLDDLFGRIGEGMKELNIVVKADVHGSAEAVKANLLKLSNDEVKINVIHSGVGTVNETDVMLASASNAIIIGFNIRPDKQIMSIAAEHDVDIRLYEIIYECIEQVEKAMKGLLAPVFKETVIGRVQVRKPIKVPHIGFIAGSYVTFGKVTRGASVRVLRDNAILFTDKIVSLKRSKDDVKEVATNFECGIGLEKFSEFQINDELEVFIVEEVKRD